jgi:hypothetical protein
MLRALLMEQLQGGWEVIDTASFEQARFQQQLDPCDVVLLDESVLANEHDLAVFSATDPVPFVLLTRDSAALVPAGLQPGGVNRVARPLALAHPALLQVILNQAAQVASLNRHVWQRETALQDCQRQVQRLVGMLWQTIPVEERTPWFSQRHMLDRLQEEVARSERHGHPLTLVLGELLGSPQQPLKDLPPEDLVNWTARQVSQNKRRHDVAGQYGTTGFMLVLPDTSTTGGFDCCKRLQPILENPRELPLGARSPVRVRFGVAGFSNEISSVKSLLGRAEKQLDLAW